MKRSMSVACSMLSGAALVVLPVAQAQASSSHTVRIWGSIDLNDDEDGWFSHDEHRVVTFDRSVTVGASARTRSFVVRECVGGEVTVRMTVTVTEQATSQLASVSAVLFEGTSCNSSDQDGSGTGQLEILDSQPGTADSLRLKVTNWEEGVSDDYADISMAMTSVPA